MARMMDAQLGKAQLSLFEVDGLLPPSPPAATSHQPAPTRRRPPARSRQRREEPSAATPRPDASTAGCSSRRSRSPAAAV